MQLNSLKRNKSNRKAKQVGRGGTRGKTSGRGTKGQSARAGRKKRPEMRDIIKRIPKLRGRGKNFLKSIKPENQVINLSTISASFNVGEVVSLATLRERGILDKWSKPKILASGKLEKALTFKSLSLSKNALEAIKKSGGKIE